MAQATVNEIIKRIGCETTHTGLSGSSTSHTTSPDACSGCLHKCAQLEATVAGLCEENDALWGAIDQLKLTLSVMQGQSALEMPQTRWT